MKHELDFRLCSFPYWASVHSPQNCTGEALSSATVFILFYTPHGLPFCLIHERLLIKYLYMCINGWVNLIFSKTLIGSWLNYLGYTYLLYRVSQEHCNRAHKDMWYH